MLGGRPLGPVGLGLALFIERVQEIGDQPAMGVMGELHRIGPAAGGTRAAEGFLAAVVMMDLERHPFEARRGLGEDEFDALGGSGKARRAGGEATRRAAARRSNAAA